MAIEKENPYKDNNPYDVVQELRVIVEDLKRAVYGDPASRSPGMFQEFDSLRRDVNLLRQELEQVKSRKPSAANWTIGYISFCAGGIFAVIAVLNQIPRNEILNIPGELAAIFAIVLAAIALYFFLSGFGWIGGNHGSH
jgi:hypothetical protein